MESQLEIIDAFVDGERVDAAELKSALAQEDGRDYLVDAWLLREAAQGDSVREAPAVVLPYAKTVSRPKSRPWMVGAAVASALFAGYLVGYQTPRGESPAPQGQDTAVATAQSSPINERPTAFPVPAATRVIQLEFHQVPGESGGG